MAVAAKAASRAVEVADMAATAVSRASRDHSNQLLRHQSKANGHRHLNLPATSSRPHSKDTAEPNSK